jgi:hypothetical protein
MSGNPKLVVEVVIGIETTIMTCGGLFCGKTTLNKGEHKGTQQA